MTAGIPEVSVVMSVHNGQRYLRAALDSVVAQQGVEFELLVVDDGSCDSTPAILAEYAARDSRMRVLTTEHVGLTRALIKGCEQARGRFIARQDADDLSLPGRLCAQATLLRADARLAFVSCWAEVIGPEDESLYFEERPSDVADARDWLVRRRIGPPGHGTVMFRADAYRAAGGYRALFRYAQDSDLWVRLAWHGELAYVPQLLYRYRVQPASISATRIRVRAQYQRLVNRLHVARYAGEDEAAIIEATSLPGPSTDAAEAGSEAASCYFIGRCLMARGDKRGAHYLRRALRADPAHWRAWCALAWFLVSRLSLQPPRPRRPA